MKDGVCSPCEMNKVIQKSILESIMNPTKESFGQEAPTQEGGVGSGQKGHTTNRPDSGRDDSGFDGITDDDSPFNEPPPKDNLDDFNTVGEPTDDLDTFDDQGNRNLPSDSIFNDIGIYDSATGKIDQIPQQPSLDDRYRDQQMSAEQDKINGLIDTYTKAGWNPEMAKSKARELCVIWL